MFESPVEKEPSSRKEMFVGVGIVVVLAVVGFAIYLHFGGRGAATPAATPAQTASATNEKADPVKDLRVVSAKMDKDYTGTTAMWLVEIKNQSQTYAYSKIAYETTYAGADNSILLQNKGEIAALTINPGETQSTQVRDALYPSGTAWYKFKIVDAKATAQ
ncbi:MAG: hypothetical protein LAN59_03255 [Acidobacteriia bacterium]|nr:hypothetical protein [Terriglobia bacterium]